MLSRLSGRQWTDHNTHDPGITILEQLCYAITDLAYRGEFPVIGSQTGEAEPWPPPREAILAGDPVSSADLRESLTALGAQNPRILPLTATAIDLFFHEPQDVAGLGELRPDPPSWNRTAAPLQLMGLRTILLQAGSITPELITQLHSTRLLGEDLEIQSLGRFAVRVEAQLEIGPHDATDQLLASIAQQLHTAITRSPGQVVDGIRTSDLLHALLDLPQVLLVRSLRLTATSNPSQADWQDWFLPVPPGVSPSLDPASTIQLFRDGLPLPFSPPLQTLGPQPEPSRPIRSLASKAPAAASRTRSLAEFPSLRRHLPAAYGVAPDALGISPSSNRSATTQQLEAYLLIFDQLLSNALAQLALLPDLLSPNDPPATGECSYGSRPVHDPPLQVDHLISLSPDAYAAWLRQAVEPDADPAAVAQRRQRFLAHLLARFGEELAPPTPGDLLVQRREFLRAISRMGGARGSGFNLIMPSTGPGGFADRLRRKLGLPATLRGSTDPPFLLIEHHLLRPLSEDSIQIRDDDTSLPFLLAVPSADPWSLQVTLVMNGALLQQDSSLNQGAIDPSAFESSVAQIFSAELPTHLSPRLLWFSDIGPNETDLWKRTLEAWTTFCAVYASYRCLRAQGEPVPSKTQLQCRDARDRLLELLDLGVALPLRDIPLPKQLVVAKGQTARIQLPFSQKDVVYELINSNTGASASPPLAKPGTGDSLEIETATIEADIIYRVRASRQSTGKRSIVRECWLDGEISVLEGINTELLPRFLDLSPLDPSVSGPWRAMLCSYGSDIKVLIPDSQNGINYELVDQNGSAVSSTSVQGNTGDITLTYPNAKEDCDLQVRATRITAVPQGVNKTLLTAVLPLRVQADPTISFSAQQAVVNHGEDGGLALGATQSGVIYHFWSRRITDEDFITDPYIPPPKSKTPNLAVAVDIARAILVSCPPQGATTQDLMDLGYASPQNTLQLAGTGTPQTIGIGPCRHDAIWVALATKTHRLNLLSEASPQTATSSVKLQQAVAVLVCPDPNVLITLVRWQQDTTTSLWHAYGLEPGVFYRFSTDGSTFGTEEGYGHQADSNDPAALKGLGQLRVGVDLALAASPSLSPDQTDTTPPPPLLTLPLGATDAGSGLTVKARRAMTGLEATLKQAPQWIRVEPQTVASGTTATIKVLGLQNHTYSLELQRNRIGPSLEGNDTTLSFQTASLTKPTTFELVIQMPSGATVRFPVFVAITP